MRASREFAYFVLTGIVGFIVDVSVLYGLRAVGLPFWCARLVSFASAVLTTWLLNRSLTFRVQQHASSRELLKYFAAMSLGGSINYLASYLTYSWISTTQGAQAIAVAIGSLLGLAVNFTNSKYLVFSAGRRPR
jgi:putative flippase GtrA